MRKRVFGRKLKRTTNQRKALFKSLTQALVLHGRIQTTEAKAKSIKGSVDKLITVAKKNTINAEVLLRKYVHPSTAIRVVQIAPIFANRQGGYTRIIKIGSRKKDNSPMVLLEFVEKIEAVTTSTKTEKARAVTEKQKGVKIAQKTPKKEAKNAKPNKTNKK